MSETSPASERSPRAMRRREADRVTIQERNALAEAMPADADLIQVVAASARQHVVVQKTQTYLIWTIGLLCFLIAVLGVTTVVSVVSVTQQSQTLDELRNLANVNKANLARATDCSTPGGKCFEESQRRNRDTFVAIGNCLATGGTPTQYRACVAAALKTAPGGG